jgi:glycosyltransferase involved in cell wall biosynthesis
VWRALKHQIIPRLRFLRDILRKNITRGFTTSPQKQKRSNKILLSAMMKGTMQEIVTDGNGRKWRENLYLGPLIRELREDDSNEILYLYTFASPFLLAVPGEVKWPGITVRPWEYYLTWRLWRTISGQSKKLTGRWKLLEGSLSFREICLYQGIPLWETLKDELKLRFDDHFPGFIKDIEISKRLIDEEKPAAIGFADEASFTNKSLLVAAHPRKIPTLVLQTGVMAANNEFLEYGCADGELEGSPSKRPLFPDRFSIYGEVTRETMKEAGYPFADGIMVTGQPRYDILARADETFDREKFRSRLNIEPDKKLALIASQPSTTFANMDELLRAVLNALKDDPQIRIVIKPKPGPSDSTDKWHQQLVAETGAGAIVLPRNSDTNEALYACDVLITGYSTVALEAMVLGKPVVTVNLTGQPDLVPYAQTGAALGVYKADNIATAVNNALYDPATRERLARGREQYLYRQFYKLDGQATKRVVELIYRMMVKENNDKVSAEAK